MKLADLQPHPMNVRVYGLLETNADFLESIKRWGIMEPIVYQPLSFDGGKNFQNIIISGHRRFLAATTFKMEAVPAKLAFPEHAPIFEAEDLLAVEQLVIESNRQRVKTAEQVGREYQELKRIQSGLAAVREKLGKATLGKDLPRGKARDIAAASLGISGVTAEKISKIIEAADSGNDAAQEALVLMNAERGKIRVETGFRMVFKREESQKGETDRTKRMQAHAKMTAEFPELCTGVSNHATLELSKILEGVADAETRKTIVAEWLQHRRDQVFLSIRNSNLQAESFSTFVRLLNQFGKRASYGYSLDTPSAIAALREPDSPHAITKTKLEEAIRILQEMPFYQLPYLEKAMDIIFGDAKRVAGDLVHGYGEATCPAQEGGAAYATNRKNGMGLTRLRALASELKIQASIGSDSTSNPHESIHVRINHLSERQARELLRWLGDEHSAAREKVMAQIGESL